MRIGIDARFLHLGQGISRYLQQYLNQLVNLDTVNEYYIFVDKKAIINQLPANFKIIHVAINWYSWREQILLPFILYKYRLDLVHFPHFNFPVLYFKPFVITIHDLILLQYPSKRATTKSQLLYRFKSSAHRFVLRQALLRAQTILTVSQNSATDICNFLPQVCSKIHITHLASHFGIDDRAFKSGKYFLSVGNAYPHKNLYHLVAAFDLFSKTNCDYRLILVGRQDYFYDQLRQHVNENFPQHKAAIIFLGAIDEDSLRHIYKKATALIFPSLYEGFGLPGLEAMSLGTPVIATNKSSLPEIFGEAAYYIDGTDVGSTVQAMQELTTNAGLRQELINKGYQVVKKYSWEKMARLTQSVYK